MKYKQTTKAMLRRTFDRLFCDSRTNYVRLGDRCAWTVERSLDVASQVISGGAGGDISFELALATKFGCRVAIFDPSPTGVETIRRYAELPKTVTYHEFGLAGTTSTRLFHKPVDPVEGSFVEARRSGKSEGVEYRCLGPKDAMQVAGLTRLDLVKLDIEGSEYGFLDALIASDRLRPRQIAVEFHHFFRDVSIRQTLRAILRLRRAGYAIRHKERFDYLFVQRDSPILGGNGI